uniref:Bifunctional inhibitor/plant lipid transfer protein/seed storage helical domain-containing protein n=1 Tax=Oryza glumipatula TaxID=40148 RepID=A0A0D9Z876_9ORYZ
MAVAARAAAVACLLVVGLAAVAGVDGATASSPAPAPAVDCTAEALKVADCLDYVTPGKTAPSRPSKLCCGEVKGALKDSAAVGCLCAAFTSKTLPLPINITRALHLPAACGADASAFSKCLAPAPSPSVAPGTSSGSGGAAAAPAKGAAAARSPMASTTAVLVVAAAVAAPLLAFFHF